MITTNIIPVATATSQNIVVQAIEKVCKPFCILGSIPTATMDFKVGPVTKVGTNVIATIFVTTTVVTTSDDACGSAKTQVFTEAFDVGFAAAGTNTITLLPGESVVVAPAGSACCKAKSIKASTTLQITIS